MKCAQESPVNSNVKSSHTSCISDACRENSLCFYEYSLEAAVAFFFRDACSFFASAHLGRVSLKISIATVFFTRHYTWWLNFLEKRLFHALASRAALFHILQDGFPYCPAFYRVQYNHGIYHSYLGGVVLRLYERFFHTSIVIFSFQYLTYLSGRSDRAGTPNLCPAGGVSVDIYYNTPS